VDRRGEERIGVVRGVDVELHRNGDDIRIAVRPWTTGRRESPTLPAFDVGVLDVADDGTFVDSTQIENVLESIQDARAHAPVDGQPVVVVFVHGWHHDSEWRRSATTRPGEDDGDPHFAAFREALRRLQLREEASRTRVVPLPATRQEILERVDPT
jgi:hypothetical protein